MSHVILGLSGGVDSAVCAALLKNAGHEVTGLYLENGVSETGACDAKTVADTLGIGLLVRDIRAELETHVCAAFDRAYRAGETPNPCILCNPTVKFKTLLETADALGAEFIATGHYARTKDGGLYKGMPANDQSYMLCRLTRAQVVRLLLPLGEFEKPQVRAMAADLGLPVSQKPDSMEICFIPDKDYAGWLAKRAPLPGPGDFVLDGEIVGRHEGICRYTVGQRRPGLVNGRKVYVSRIDAETNTIRLAYWDDLFRTAVTARDFSWLIDPPAEPVRASVRVRHTKWENPPCTAVIEGDLVRIECDEPVRAPAPGQSAVLYDGDRVLGGGTIVG